MEKSSITNLIYRVKKKNCAGKLNIITFSLVRAILLWCSCLMYMFEVRVGMEHTKKKIDLYVCYTFLYGLFAGANQIKKKSFNFN